MLPRHDEAEDAALSELAGELDGPAQEPRQALADVQPEAGAFTRSGDSKPLELLESLEELGLVFLLDPRAGVDHVEPDVRDAVRVSLAAFNPDLTLVCELDRVAAEVDQDLVQRPAVGDGRQDIFWSGHSELEAFVAGQRAQPPDDLFSPLSPIERQKVSFPFARLDLGEVQQV